MTTRSTRSSPRSRSRCATRGGRCARVRARATASCARSGRSAARSPRTRSSAAAATPTGSSEHVHLTPPLFAQLVEDATFSYTFFRDLPGALRRLPRAATGRRSCASRPRTSRSTPRAAARRGTRSATSRPSPATTTRRSGTSRRLRRRGRRSFAVPSPGCRRACSRRSQSASGWARWTRTSSSSDASAGRRRASPTRRSRRARGRMCRCSCWTASSTRRRPSGDARLAAAAWPDSTYVQVRNTNHVSALADFQGCASGLVRRFLTHLAAGDTSCAGRVPAVEVARFPARLGAAPLAHALAGDRSTPAARRAAWAAGAVVGDAFTRWYNLMFGVDGHGLRGGRFTRARRVLLPPPAADPVPRRPLRLRPGGLGPRDLEPGRRTACGRRSRWPALRAPPAGSCSPSRPPRAAARRSPPARLGGRRLHVAFPVPWTPQD